MNKAKIILAGGSGFLGRALAAALLERKYEVCVLTRTPGSKRAGEGREVRWDGRTAGPWVAELEGAAAIVNLTGKSVNCRYIPEMRREIVASRVDSVKALEQALRGCQAPPPVWVQASSLAIYGDAGDRWCDESAPPGEGFSVETCLAWERAFEEVPASMRKVVLRIGFALSSRGGALWTLSNLTKAFLGGAVGSGRQYISWIHLADLNRMFLEAIENPQLSGIFHATAPHPVTNADFMRALRQALHRPWSPAVPVWATHLGAWLLGTEPALALTGRRGTPARFLAAGFQFQFPDLVPALNHLVANHL